MSSYLENEAKIEELVGETIRKIVGLEKQSEQVDLILESGKVFRFYHEQNCCEGVDLEDFECDGIDGGKILSAEVVASAEVDKLYDHETWTFYKIETTEGGLWMRWYGTSNGFYSEKVDLIWVNKEEIVN